MIEYRAILPGDVLATFRFRPGRGVEVEWDPGVPKRRHWKRDKFRRAYLAARRDFLELCADQLGGPVLILTPGADVDELETVAAPRRH